MVLTTSSKKFIKKHQRNAFSYQVELNPAYQTNQNANFYEDWLVDLRHEGDEYVSISTGDQNAPKSNLVMVQTSAFKLDTVEKTSYFRPRVLPPIENMIVVDDEGVEQSVEPPDSMYDQHKFDCSAAVASAPGPAPGPGPTRRLSLTVPPGTSSNPNPAGPAPSPFAGDSHDNGAIADADWVDDGNPDGKSAKPTYGAVQTSGENDEFFYIMGRKVKADNEGFLKELWGICAEGSPAAISTASESIKCNVGESVQIGTFKKRKNLTIKKKNSRELGVQEADIVSPDVSDDEDDPAYMVWADDDVYEPDEMGVDLNDDEASIFSKEITYRMTDCESKYGLVTDPQTPEAPAPVPRYWVPTPTEAPAPDADAPSAAVVPTYQAPGPHRLLGERRKLGIEEAFSSSMLGVFDWRWCGPGTIVKNEDCPENGGAAAEHDDIEYMCRRHDHAKKIAQGSFGMPRLTCQADYDIQVGTTIGATCWAAIALCISVFPVGCAAALPLCDAEDVIGIVYGSNSPYGMSQGCYNIESVATPVYSPEAAHNHWCNCGWRGCSWGCASNHGATYVSSYDYSTQEVIRYGSNRYNGGNLHNYGYNAPGLNCVGTDIDGSTSECVRICPSDSSVFTSTNSWN